MCLFVWVHVYVCLSIVPVTEYHKKKNRLKKTEWSKMKCHFKT